VPEKIFEIMTNDPWRDLSSVENNCHETLPVFKTAGGFSGFGSQFCSLPVAVLIDDSFYATDGEEVFRIFADYYGVELVRDHSLTPDEVLSAAVLDSSISDGKIYFCGNGFTLPAGWKTGITSIAVNKNTAVWTLKDSYKLYIAGIRGKNA